MVKFPTEVCRSCPVKAKCTTATRGGRQLTLRPRPVQQALDTARAEQSTTQWQTRYALRAGVESTIGQATKVTNVRHTRYRGLAKVRLEHNVMAAALNLIRLDAWWNGGEPGTGRRAPLPGGQDLPALVSGAAEAGMRVTSRISIGDLPPAVGCGVYRIVQEALTNAAKHAPGSPTVVEVAADREAVAVSVVNPLNDAGAGESRPGCGLASIRDRAELLGGTASTGRTGQDEFAVRAVLPLHAALPTGPVTRCSLDPGCGCLGCAILRRVFG